MLIGVPWFDVDSVWAQVEPFVHRCLRKSGEHRYWASDIREMVERREAQLWIQGFPEVDGVVLTKIQKYPRATECVIFMVCGTLKEEWKSQLFALVEGSTSLGCTHASAYVRPGFMKLLDDWEQRQTYIVRKLS